MGSASRHGAPPGPSDSAPAPAAPTVPAAPVAPAAPTAPTAPPSAQGQLVNAEQAAAALAAAATATALTVDTMATRPPPAGFVWSVLRDVTIHEVAETYLYVRASKNSQSTRAIPIPKDRALLRPNVAGGTVDDLQRGAVITAKFDPKGEVRPEIVIQQRVETEVLEGVRVLDRGGNKLYVTDSQGKGRGFAIEGGAEAWNEVVAGGSADDLRVGAKVTVRFDPTGREPLRVTLLEPAPGGSRRDNDPGKDGGCGCDVRSTSKRLPTSGEAFAALAFGLLLLRARRPASKPAA